MILKGINALIGTDGEADGGSLDTLPYTHFPGVLLQPLGHLSRTAAMVGVLAVLIKGFKQF
ncbi:MAG TPA: hypothetical protein DCS01_03110 [Idiomarina abyssalis]|nr:hypothetical protein [Idiomarina sp.]MBH94506.1 hypothetical protein [Idiomarina sp.]HAS14273.1 hypothetical protein [Idiomarina abyssalis]